MCHFVYVEGVEYVEGYTKWNVLIDNLIKLGNAWKKSILQDVITFLLLGTQQTFIIVNVNEVKILFWEITLITNLIFKWRREALQLGFYKLRHMS